jgi:hypothetical protein
MSINELGNPEFAQRLSKYLNQSFPGLTPNPAVKIVT